MEKKLTKKQKLWILGIIGYIVLIGGIIGFTYSYFLANAEDTTTIAGYSASIDLQLTVTKLSTDANDGLYPYLDSKITDGIVGTNGKLCLDEIGNTVCQVYKLDVKSKAAMKVDGDLILNAGDNPNLKWARITGITNPELIGDVKTHNNTIFISGDSIPAGTTTYYIVIWITELGVPQYDTGEFTGIVRFDPAVTPSQRTLRRLGLEHLINTTTIPIYANIATTDEGIFKTEDDLGDTYFFRGASLNNYVYFAGYYWRIIRINGDGTIRMIYDGPTARANGTSSSSTQIGTSAYNSSYQENKYVGYMYGANNSAHSNVTNSTIKTVVENWYRDKIASNVNYAPKVADAIYCNDRSFVSGTGLGTTATNYSAYDRLYTKKEPSLKCKNAEDKFTFKDGDLDGNKMLTYPVGLITADEVSIAGGVWNINNSNYYLYTGNYYWTMSPYVGGSSSSAFGVNSGGSISPYFVYSSNGVGVRPVLSLKSDIAITGQGTQSNPFKVQ